MGAELMTNKMTIMMKKKATKKIQDLSKTSIGVNKIIFICLIIIILFDLIINNNNNLKPGGTRSSSGEQNPGWPLLGAEAGSKSKEKSSKTTVIAIDGGGGGGKPHPVPVPWPVIHCHHHHHHMKYVPKPVLVHHWVKKYKPSGYDDLAASAPESIIMGQPGQPPVVGMASDSVAPAALDSHPSSSSSSSSSLLLSAQYNPFEVSGPQFELPVPADSGNAINSDGQAADKQLAYELSEGSRLVSTLNNVFDDSTLSQQPVKQQSQAMNEGRQIAQVIRQIQHQQNKSSPSSQTAASIKSTNKQKMLENGKFGSQYDNSTRLSAIIDDDSFLSSGKQFGQSSGNKPSTDMDVFKASSNDNLQQQRPDGSGGRSNFARTKMSSGKPSHPFDDPHDQLIDETRQEQNQQVSGNNNNKRFLKSLELANVLEQNQAKRLFDRLNQEHTSRMERLQQPMQNIGLVSPIMNQFMMNRPLRLPQQPALTQTRLFSSSLSPPSSSSSSPAISARAASNSIIAESQAIELMTKLANQMAQLEAKKLLDKQQQLHRHRTTSPPGRKSTPPSQVVDEEEEEDNDGDRPSGKLFHRMNILSSLFSQPLKSNSHRDKRRQSAPPPSAKSPVAQLSSSSLMQRRPLTPGGVMMISQPVRMGLERLAHLAAIRPRALFEQTPLLGGDLQSVESKSIRTFNLGPGNHINLDQTLQLAPDNRMTVRSLQQFTPPRPSSRLFERQPQVIPLRTGHHFNDDELNAQASNQQTSATATEQVNKPNKEQSSTSRVAQLDKQATATTQQTGSQGAHHNHHHHHHISTTLSPDLENRFYLGQREHLSKIKEQIMRDQLVDEQMMNGVAVNPKSNITRVYSSQSSEVHNSIIDPSNLIGGDSSNGLATTQVGEQQQQAATRSSQVKSSSDQDQMHDSNNNNNRVQPSSKQQDHQSKPNLATNAAAADSNQKDQMQTLLINKHTWPMMFQQTSSMEEQQPPSLMNSYIEFPMSPQQWSSEALKSINSMGSQQQNSWETPGNPDQEQNYPTGEQQTVSAESDETSQQTLNENNKNYQPEAMDIGQQNSLAAQLGYGPAAIDTTSSYPFVSNNMNLYGNLASQASQSAPTDFETLNNPMLLHGFQSSSSSSSPADHYKSFATNPYEIFWRPTINQQQQQFHNLQTTNSIGHHEMQLKTLMPMQSSGSNMKPFMMAAQQSKVVPYNGYPSLSQLPETGNYPGSNSQHQYEDVYQASTFGGKSIKGAKGGSALMDPLDVAQNDMNQLGQFQDFLSKSAPYSAGTTSNANNFTAMTRFSNQLRSTNGLQGRLPQMPQMPNIPNIPQPPQMPGVMPGMMQMASLALPFAMARATRNHHRIRDQQVNAAAQNGGTTAGQRFFNNAARLLRRRPLNRRPRPNGSGSSPSPATRMPNLNSPSHRNKRLQRFVQTVVDMGRRAPGRGSSSSTTTGGHKLPGHKLAASALAVAANGAASAAAAAAGVSAAKIKPKVDLLDRGDFGSDSKRLGRSIQQQQQQQHQTGSILATLNDGSLAKFSSMTSPIDMLNLQLQERPLAGSISSGKPHRYQYEYGKSNIIPLVGQNAARPAKVPINHQTSLSSQVVALGAAQEGQDGQYVTETAIGSLNLAPTTPLVPFPLLANHINFLLFTAQNLTNHSSAAGSIATTLRPTEQTTTTTLTPRQMEDDETTTNQYAAAAASQMMSGGEESLDQSKQHEALRLQQEQISGVDETSLNLNSNRDTTEQQVEGMKSASIEQREHRQADSSSLVPIIGLKGGGFVRIADTMQAKKQHHQQLKSTSAAPLRNSLAKPQTKAHLMGSMSKSTTPTGPISSQTATTTGTAAAAAPPPSTTAMPGGGGGTGGSSLSAAGNKKPTPKYKRSTSTSIKPQAQELAMFGSASLADDNGPTSSSSTGDWPEVEAAATTMTTIQSAAKFSSQQEQTNGAATSSISNTAVDDYVRAIKLVRGVAYPWPPPPTTTTTTTAKSSTTTTPEVQL